MGHTRLIEAKNDRILEKKKQTAVTRSGKKKKTRPTLKHNLKRKVPKITGVKKKKGVASSQSFQRQPGEGGEMVLPRAR